MLTLAVMASWSLYVVDVQGAFLNGRFEAGERLFLRVPDGFKDLYSPGDVLHLKRTIYGLKQSAVAFWTELVKALNAMGFEKTQGDPCCYVKRQKNRIIVCLSWVDDCLFIGNDNDVIEAKRQIMEFFECDDVGYCNEYVGCVIKNSGKSISFTQPVLIRSFTDEFDADETKIKTPVSSGITLQFNQNAPIVNAVQLKKYQAGIGKLLYLARWSRPDISNIVRELARYSSRAQNHHVSTMKRVMDYCVTTKDKGLILNLTARWNGKDDGKFVIRGVSDSDYAKDLESRRSVTGYSVFLNDSPVAMKSKMQDIVTLSVTEAEIVAATMCIQEMLYVKKVIEGIGLEIELPMIIEVDNKGAKDLMNNWSVGGRTKHIDVRYFHIRKLKEANMVKIEWIPSEENCSDIFTKNLGQELFNKHSNVFVGDTSHDG